MNKKLLLTVTGLIFSLFVYSQSVLKGTVFNTNHEPLNSASVTCKNNTTGESRSITTSLDGEFKFKELTAGTYEVKIQFVGFLLYDKQIKLDDDDKKEISVQLTEISGALQNVNVFSKINGENESSSRLSEKNANNITNVISARAMERSPDINAANVLQRMSGVTLQKNSGADEAYAIIRGMEPRYNNTLINGVKITSPDEKSRFVSLNIVPSDLLQKIEVSKSLTPEMEGDAIGGTVNLVMKDAPDSAEFKVTGSIGYSNIFFNRKYTTFSKSDIQQQSIYQKFGANYTAQPNDFSRSNLDFNSISAPTTALAGFSYGKRFLKNKLGILIADNLQNQYYGANSQFNIVSPDPNNHFQPYITDVANRTSSTQQLNNGLSLHVDYNFNDKNKIIINNIFLYSYLAQARLSIDTAIVGGNGGRTIAGTGPIGGDDRSLTNHEYLENLKVEGKHILTPHLFFDWAGVFSSAVKKSPDEATISTNKKIYIDSAGHFVTTPVYFDGISRIWQHNSDKDYNIIGNLTYKQKFNTVLLELKAGGLYRHKDRSNEQNEYDLRPIPADTITGIKQVFMDINSAQWTVYNPHGTFNYDVNNYQAHEDISVGFAEAKISLKALDIVGGVRYENTSQGYSINTFDPNPESSLKKTYADLLPSAMIKFKLNAKTNLRASYYKSISRPNYYELVPYTIRGINYDEVGNPYLQHTVADNFDLRYEYFPRDEEQLFVSGFYKRLKNPIENTLIDLSGGQLVFTPQNFADATIIGAELVVTKYFGNFGVTGNYTFIHSNVNSPKIVPDSASLTGGTIFKTQTRPLQGQSNNVVNLSLLYKNDKRKIFAQLAYEFIGKTLSEVYPNYGYDYYQQPQSFLSLSAEKSFSNHFTLFGKLNNILNTPTLIEINGITVGKDIYKANFNIGIRYSH
ncbi:MAG: TonB-dependent receptor domain-containing protein [Chitinophagaceae bacterium]